MGFKLAWKRKQFCTNSTNKIQRLTNKQINIIIVITLRITATIINNDGNNNYYYYHFTGKNQQMLHQGPFCQCTGTSHCAETMSLSGCWVYVSACPSVTAWPVQITGEGHSLLHFVQLRGIFIQLLPAAVLQTEAKNTCYLTRISWP